MRALAAAVTLVTSTVLVIASGLAVATASPAAGGGGGNGGSGSCDPYVDGTVIPVPCSSGSTSGGSGGPGIGGGAGSTIDNTCTFVALDEAQAKNLGLAWPPPAGKHWALMDCIGGATGTGQQAVLVTNGGGAPEVTPQQLLVQALGELHVPYLQPATAPPRGTDGLVGLPEWFWVPAGEWHARSVTVTAGPVWATATAVPAGLTIEPGAGLSPVTCAGPGVAYDRRKPAAGQHTNCSYTYLQPSAGQPANAYRASATVTWRISWTGSGGAGGLLDAGLAVPVGFAVVVAQGEALVTSP
jgi:hypothetical protein